MTWSGQKHKKVIKNERKMKIGTTMPTYIYVRMRGDDRNEKEIFLRKREAFAILS